MNSTNAYQTPECVELASPRPVLVLWFIASIFLSAVLGGILGACGGAMIGTFAPAYYRSVFRNGNEAYFNPFEVGVGLGAVQGTGIGLMIGIISIIVFSWYRSRRLRGGK